MRECRRFKELLAELEKVSAVEQVHLVDSAGLLERYVVDMALRLGVSEQCVLTEHLDEQSIRSLMDHLVALAGPLGLAGDPDLETVLLPLATLGTLVGDLAHAAIALFDPNHAGDEPQMLVSNPHHGRPCPERRPPRRTRFERTV